MISEFLIYVCRFLFLDPRSLGSTSFTMLYWNLPVGLEEQIDKQAQVDL